MGDQDHTPDWDWKAQTTLHIYLSSDPSLNLKVGLQIPTAVAPRVKKNCHVLSAAKSLSTSSGNAEEDRNDTLLYSPMATHMGPLRGEPQAASLARSSHPPEVLLQVSYHLSDASLAPATERSYRW